ncbi:UDP-glucoronosyl and UDP-glucosyl transferase [Colletotrichum higginsianum IMI 349063]|uniref:UDP-glucoronosyl and UDP-glucosyl transferase n=4 Tax=Colletotrichum higginsianum TaxID=80884 RepID=A0A1B7YBM5_COLHI|nr:UDP-glucoronosyl and UDP-glucosyl transferase [Colletotrichum higginsianum IMI 349063]OBR09486.1 UDP-glucoronosyl and UDP-glucosyl transferase [Colletotrichum higginsianum IMI 349063]TIC95757.1 UDP-glycosyltransferase 84B1 [Colletotrichum higginsianum]
MARDSTKRTRGFSSSFFSLVVPLLVAALFYKLTSSSSPQEPDYDHVPGTPDTVLFLASANRGQHNVQLATIQGLLERHPGVRIHVASAPYVGGSLERIAGLVRSAGPPAPDPVFHTLDGLADVNADIPRLLGTNRSFGELVMHRPGAAGARAAFGTLKPTMSPWSCDEYAGLYRRIADLVDEVDPAVVVLDFALRPAIDVARHKRRRRVYISPMPLANVLGFIQPSVDAIWKYPTLGTDFPFPLPWKHVPSNIVAALSAMVTFATPSAGTASPQCLEERGIHGSFGPMTDPGVMWITPGLSEAAIPVDQVPAGAVRVGPITLSVRPLVEQSPELARWLRNAPTVYINMGSLFRYTEARVDVVSRAVRLLLEQTPVQVLWKLGETDKFGDVVRGHLGPLIDRGRVVVTGWIDADPTALLETGDVVCFVHHGGANSFHEALSAGVPQVIVPMWLDLYNIAQVAESSGVGVYATRGTAPEWTVDGLLEPLLKVVGDGEDGLEIRAKAATVGRKAREDPGRYAAAGRVASLAAPRGL